MTTTSKQNKRARWASWILMILIILPFTMSGIMKLMQSPEVVQGFSKLGIPQQAILPIAIVELACLAIFLIPQTAILGTLLLTGYLGGAVLANIIGRTDFIHALVIGLMVWICAWLRVPEFGQLVPLRKAAVRKPEPSF
jgi:uncharacterized membrane protein YphA (DoxX/SURF4 family)